MTQSRQATLWAIAAGALWGLALGHPLGAPLALAGVIAFAGLFTGNRSGDALRGLLAGTVTCGLWFRELPSIWNTYGDGGGSWLWVGLVGLHALPFAAAAALASRDGAFRGIDLALALAAVTAMVGLWPVPIDLATLFAASPPLLWPVALLGSPLLTAVLGLAGGWIRTGRVEGFALVCAWVLLGCGWWALPQPVTDLTVAIVQPNTGVFDAERPSTIDHRSREFVNLLHVARDGGAAIALTPETSWPHASPPPTPLPTIIGHVVDGRNRLTGDTTFDKIRLVPLAERTFLSLGDQAFTPGTGPREIAIAGVSFAPLICFEDLQPSALRAAVRSSPGPLLLATNDGWLALENAGDKHLAVSILAAVRTQRWAARPSTSGTSAVITPRGALPLRTTARDGGAGAVGEVHFARIALYESAWAPVSAEPWLGLAALVALLARRRA